MAVEDARAELLKAAHDYAKTIEWSQGDTGYPPLGIAREVKSALDALGHAAEQFHRAASSPLASEPAEPQARADGSPQLH